MCLKVRTQNLEIVNLKIIAILRHYTVIFILLYEYIFLNKGNDSEKEMD